MNNLTIDEKKWISNLLYIIIIILVCFLGFTYKGHITKDFNSAQTIYMAIFALYFAVTISTTRGLQLFDTVNWKYPKTRRRFFLSLFFMNFVPLLFFWITLKCLSYITFNICFASFFVLAVIFFQGIIGFGLYRIFFGILISLSCEDHQYFFYDKLQYPPKEEESKEDNYKFPIDDVLKDRPLTHKDPFSHILPGLLWVFVTLVLLVLMLLCVFPIPN